MLKQWIVLFTMALVTLTACHSNLYDQAEANVADVKLRSAAARRLSDCAKKCPALVVKHGMYVDTTPISLKNQPNWLRSHIVIRGDSLPFSYYSRTIASGANGNVLTRYQYGLDPSLNVSINYAGPIKGALDLLSAKTGYVYGIRHNSIYWQAFLTRTFDIAFMPGSADYLLGKTSSGGSSASTSSQGALGSSAQVSNYVSSDYSNNEYSNLKGTLSLWKDLEATITQILSPQGKVMVSESTTSVTVRDRPTNVELVGQFIRNLNHHLSKQVLVKIQILEVDLQNDYNFGIDWSVITKAFHNTNFIINSNFGTPITIVPFSTQPGAPAQLYPQFGTQLDPTKTGQVPAYNILFNALNQQGKTSVVSEPRVVCLNNQVSVVRIVKSEGYAASVQNTSIAGGGTAGGSNNLGTVTSQITPGMVITGLTLYILPKIYKNKIYLQVNADISTNNGFKTFGPTPTSGQPVSQIQLPNITEKHFNQRSMIHSGDILILSGFRQLTNQANANQFLKSQALGGKGAQELNAETIILITPIILNGCVA